MKLSDCGNLERKAGGADAGSAGPSVTSFFRFVYASGISPLPPARGGLIYRSLEDGEMNAGGNLVQM